MRFFTGIILFFTAVIISSAQGNGDQLLWSEFTRSKPVTFSQDNQWLLAKLHKGGPGGNVMPEKDTIQIFDVLTGELLFTFRDAMGIVNADLSPDRKLLATGTTKGVVKIRNIETNEIIHTFTDATLSNPVSGTKSLKFSPTGTEIMMTTPVIADSAKPSIFLWSLATGMLKWKLHLPGVQSAEAFFNTIKSAPQIIATGISSGANKYSYYLINSQTGEMTFQELVQIKLRQYSPDGRYYMNFGDSVIYNSLVNTPFTTLPLVTVGGVQAFSSQSQYFLHSYIKGISKYTDVWEISTAKKIRTYQSDIVLVSEDLQYMALSAFPLGQMYQIGWNTTSVENADKNILNFSAHPNPAFSESTISFTLLKESAVTLSVFNANGRKVADLTTNNYEAGKNHFYWNTTTLPQGMYFIKLEAEGKTAQIPCSIIR